MTAETSNAREWDGTPTWRKQKPTRAGVYGVRGFNFGVPASEQFEAIVAVRLYNGELICNLHCSTSEDDFDDWSLVEDCSDEFEWCEFAAAPPPAAAEVRVYQCPRCATSMEVDPTAKPEAVPDAVDPLVNGGYRLTKQPVEPLSESDKDIAVAQAVEFAAYVESHAKGKMVDAARRFLSLPYSREIAARLQQPAAAKVIDSLIVANEETHAAAKELAACLADAVAAGATDIPLTHRAGVALKRYEALATQHQEPKP